MSETANQEGAPAAGEAPKKGKTKLIVILLLVFLLLGAGGGGGYYYFVMAANAADGEEAEDHSESKKKKKKKKKKSKKSGDEEDEDSEPNELLGDALPDDEDVKHIIELPAFIINLADAEEARYLRMTVNLGVGEEGESKEPNKLFITRVRNAMLAVLSTKRSEEVLSVKGKSKLRKELLEAAEAASDEPEVLAIYITDFIVQL
ncbi:MAG: flagellar basal body-associated FliL family protein [Pyrinomonadaceae bacterium]|nr:flagellar basal body-associated FliL family protein [Pyrinomonadaceae bacterium]